MNRLTFVLLLLAVGLGLLLVNHDSGRTFGIDNEKFGQIVYLLPIAGLLSVGILAGSRGSFASVVRQLAIWLVIILGLVSVYLYRYDLQSFADRLLGGLMPGRAVVVTERGVVSGEPTRLLLDGDWQPVAAWAGPWPVDESWWSGGERSSRFQVVGADGRAWLLCCGPAGWRVEAGYD